MAEYRFTAIFVLSVLAWVLAPDGGHSPSVRRVQLPNPTSTMSIEELLALKRDEMFDLFPLFD